MRDLKVAKDVPVSGVAQEGSISEFPQLMAAEVVGELSTVSWAMAPARGVSYPGVRLRICEETLNEHQAWWGGSVDADTPENSDQEAPADQGAPAVSKGGDGNEKPVDPAHEHKHEHESQSVTGPESLKEPAKPEHADRNPARKAVAAGKTASKSSNPTNSIKSKGKDAHVNDEEEGSKPGTAPSVAGKKTAPKSNSPAKLGHKSNRGKGKNNYDADDADRREEEEEEETGGEARPRKRRAPADEEDTGNSAGKPRKRTRALKKITVKN